MLRLCKRVSVCNVSNRQARDHECGNAAGANYAREVEGEEPDGNLLRGENWVYGGLSACTRDEAQEAVQRTEERYQVMKSLLETGCHWNGKRWLVV